MVLVCLLIGSYFIFLDTNKDVKIFHEKSIAFTDLHFNRFVVYKNSFEISEHMQKQAMFYLNGVASVNFSTDNLEFNPSTNSVVLYYDEIPFRLNTSFKQTLLVDQIDPQPITKKQAQAMGAVVGVAGGIGGGIVGSKAGGLIGKLTGIPFMNLAGGGIGALAGAGTAYYFAVDALDGATITDEISESEKREVTDNAKELIIASLHIELQNDFKQRFEEYITSVYAQNGILIQKIEYIEKGHN